MLPMQSRTLSNSLRPRSVVTRLLIVSAAALSFSACSSSSSSSGPAATVPADVGLQVVAGPGIKFDAPAYTAKSGDVKVLYTNRDSQRHTLAIVDSTGKTLPGEMEVVKSGSTDVKTYALAAGTYKLICTVPGHNAMKATLTVS